MRSVIAQSVRIPGFMPVGLPDFTIRLTLEVNWIKLQKIVGV
jgi:hypothetical protein